MTKERPYGDESPAEKPLLRQLQMASFGASILAPSKFLGPVIIPPGIPTPDYLVRHDATFS